MKKLIYLIILSLCFTIVKAQTNTGIRIVTDPKVLKADGDGCFDRKDYQCALSNYLTVLKTDSDNFKLLRRVGYCFMNSNNTADEVYAVNYFNRALKIQPNDTLTNYYLGELSSRNKKNQTVWTAGDEKIYGSKDERDFEVMVSHASNNHFLCRYIGFTQFYTNNLSEYLETNRQYSVDGAVFKSGYEIKTMTRSGVYSYGVKPPKLYITYALQNGRITSVKINGPLIELVNLFLWYWPYDAVWSDQVKLKPGVVAAKHSFGDLVSFKWNGNIPYIIITKDPDMIMPVKLSARQ